MDYTQYDEMMERVSAIGIKPEGLPSKKFINQLGESDAPYLCYLDSLKGHSRRDPVKLLIQEKLTGMLPAEAADDKKT